MDQPDFTSVDAKLGRAVEHYETVYNEIKGWAETCKTHAGVEHNPDYTAHAIRYHVSGPDPDFQRWTLIVGDCINNMRCALDHLIYAIAKHQTVHKPSANIERLAFILTDKPDEFTTRDNEKRLGVGILSSEVVDAVRQVQPFSRPHPILPPLLQILRKFSNSDKHRFLEVANSAVVEWDLSFFGNPKTKFHIAAKPIKDQDIIGLIETPEPHPHLTLEGSKISTAVTLRHGLKDGETNLINARTGISILIPLLLNEVKFAIDTVKFAAIEK